MSQADLSRAFSRLSNPPASSRWWFSSCQATRWSRSLMGQGSGNASHPRFPGAAVQPELMMLEARHATSHPAAPPESATCEASSCGQARTEPRRRCPGSAPSPGERSDAVRPDFLPAGKKSALDPHARRIRRVSSRSGSPGSGPRLPIANGARATLATITAVRRGRSDIPPRMALVLSTSSWLTFGRKSNQRSTALNLCNSEA